MSLSCNCDFDYEFNPGDFLYSLNGDSEFVPLDTIRAKRCCSCNVLIRVGETCVKYDRYRYPYSNVESQIRCGCDLDDCFSDEPTIKIPTHYHCEWCGEIFYNLRTLGFECLMPNEDMRGLLKEYHELSGFRGVEK